MKVTFVIPTYNEAENLPRLVSALFDLPLPELSLLVVDDNSPDGTGRIADELAVQTSGRVDVLHRSGKLGLGSAYIQGFQRAMQQGADAIGQMDADFSHPVEKVPALIDALQTCDYAIGSRYVPGGSLDERWPFWRKALSGWGNFYARTILGLPIRDVTGGFKLWKASTLRAMPLERIKSNGYVFQVEMNYVASRLGFHACEIPIYFADRRWGQSKMNFRIQVEAAIRTWQLLGMYHDLQKQ
ncbi:glycosyltransferase [Anaerolinea thermolimosa]|uniref:polyprenol monophosphomannose synthase n=1 Tax=Anaerolinea thermolimosa TaxID=229919 RepID=UPI000784A3AF|nr:polyprenol monophosphomannose synthase [Anaerolinea thermolimosa]GAP05344.1 glycosyltransferase [Anaerolinea thermolimosa]